MKYWIRQPASDKFLGPFTQQELGQHISSGEIKWDDEALEANGQSYGALKQSTNWCPLRVLFPSQKISAQTPRSPTERDYCFIVRGDERRGPYLPSQIREMWKNGSITADSGLLWGERSEAVPITMLIAEPGFAHSEVSGGTGGTGRNQGLIVLGGILFVGGVIGLGYYWQGFDTSVSVPATHFMGETFETFGTEAGLAAQLDDLAFEAAIDFVG